MAEYIFTSGVVVPDTGDLLATVQDEFRAAFGLDLIVTANTPQGVLITAEVLARDAVLRNNAAIANQINPNLAGGIFLDAIWALTGGARLRATPSLIASVTLTGSPGAVIPAGSQASVGVGGPLFESVGDVTIGADGTAAIAFQSVDLGPVAAPADELNTIVSGVLGWESVNNPAPAVLGLARESDLAARARRRNTLALQGTSLAEAILSNVWDVPGVSSALLRENFTNAPVVIEGTNLAPNSIFVCVDGGADDDVAGAIFAKKSLGCNWNGGTIVNVTEPASGQVYPVRFQRPELVPIFMKLTVRAGSSVSEPAQAVRDAVLAYANGSITGEEGFDIGGDVSAFEIAGAVNITVPAIYVAQVVIGTDPGALSANAIPITIAQRATILEGDIQVEFV
jgi:uncharacterized phage protein gp47/JayE